MGDKDYSGRSLYNPSNRERNQRSQRGGRQREKERDNSKEESSRDPPAILTQPQLLQHQGNAQTRQLPPENKNSAILFSENLQIRNEPYSILSDNNDFLVVGIIGPQGTGKSTFLSYLYGKSDPEVDSIFEIETKEQLMRSSHQTRGIQMTISRDRLILLDTQPIFSASVLAQKIQQESSPMPPHGSTYEQVYELECLQMGIFLLSVCHILIVMDNEPVNINLWKYLKTLEMLKWNIPDPSAPGLSPTMTINEDFGFTSNEYYPEIIFLNNQLGPECFYPRDLIQIKNSINTFFNDSKLKRKECINLKKFITGYKSSDQPSMNIYFLPDFYENGHQAVSEEFHESYDNLVEDILQQISLIERKGFLKPITEQEWLRNSLMIWDQIRNSSLIKEYAETAQKIFQ